MMLDTQQTHLTEELQKFIDEGFSRYAIEKTGHDEKFDPVAFVAKDEDEIAGTVVVARFWGNLHIKYVIVEEKYRGNGIATDLMEQAFAYGRKHNCRFAFVETMNFQAQGFYQKLGFQLEFTREGFSHGTSIHHLRKLL
jgi:ribosomal protein S18 acetylase RimI-like enzyme